MVNMVTCMVNMVTYYLRTAITLVWKVQFPKFCVFLKAPQKLYQMAFSTQRFQYDPILRISPTIVHGTFGVKQNWSSEHTI